MTRPDVEAILGRLKPFQRRTVDHAFHRLFVAEDSTARFLVADEVGLGKTLVARGVIARTIDHLWEKVERIDVVYICSGGSIARSNLPKLHVAGAGERTFALATRLTMLATELAAQNGRPGIAESKVNFVSFTPRTSFEMGHSPGRSEEREVLFQLLVPHLGRGKGLMNLLQGGIRSSERWRARLSGEARPIEPTIQKSFDERYRSNANLRTELESLLEEWFGGRVRKHWPVEALARRNAAIAALRQLLAEVCVEALQPDLVILDEFQRFKALLDSDEDRRDPAAELAQALFRARTPEGQPVRTLLLSATPYKLYTADAEIEHEDHYADFLATTRFLLKGDDARVSQIQRALSRFGSSLKRAAVGDDEDVRPAKAAVEGMLRAVMARTERVAASEDRDAMVAEHGSAAPLNVRDVEQYLAADALFRAVGDRDPMAFWKSAPYLAHFMHGYKVNERIDDALANAPATIAKVLRAHCSAFLDRESLERWSQLDAANAKLRELVRTLVDSGLWRLLWLPPTTPYWPLEQAFQDMEGSTKTLLFSAWSVVPEVVSSVLSYEAERLMAGTQLRSYTDPSTQQAQLLRLTPSTSGARSRQRLLLLLLPCLPLADHAHPLSAPPTCDRRQWVRERVAELLAAAPDPDAGEVDDRWEWAWPLALDQGLQAFLVAWQDDELLPRPNPEHLGAHLSDLIELDVKTLGRRPVGLLDLATEVALGSPAVLAARTMLPAALDENARRRAALTVAGAFWRLFNRPTVITLLTHLQGEPEGHRRDEAYWRLVLRYCQHGNLQAVLDEQWHYLWEQQAWSERETAESMAAQCADMLTETIEPRASRVHARFYRVDEGLHVEREELRIRTDFALRFGDIRTEEQELSQDAVRDSFNSPFRPFVLATTSIGQEGLDFHPWCHRLVHWNLPGNPVDLEQREGRVNRYKCHAVRRNVAARHAAQAHASWQQGDDLWALMFDHALSAARDAGESDLVPYWIAPGSCRVERHVPMLPYSKEIEEFRRLKRQLAAYRLVFGQPRQEELVTLLERAPLRTEELRAWAIDLSPPAQACASVPGRRPSTTSD